MTQRNPDKLSSQIDAGVKLAVAQAIERHSRLGQSISIWKDGEVVTLSADEIGQKSPALSSERG
jgi:hypothetical protein